MLLFFSGVSDPVPAGSDVHFGSFDHVWNWNWTADAEVQSARLEPNAHHEGRVPTVIFEKKNVKSITTADRPDGIDLFRNSVK